MFSLNRIFPPAAAVVLSLAILTGCKTSEKNPQPAPPQPPAPAVTNQPTPPLAAHPEEDSGDTMLPNILTWDSTAKEYEAKSGEMSAPFTFSFTNVSHGPVVIYDTSTSCDCTVATMPSKPWTVPSGGSGSIDASINLSNKVGVVTNYIIVFTSQGNRRLNVKAIVPAK